MDIDLSEDKKLNAKFNKLKKIAIGPKSKKPKPVVKRRRGRPKDGRILFQKARIESLPQYGHLAEVARKLGIKHTTLQQWCALPIHPLPCIEKDGHKVFRKDVVILWLKSTKRYSVEDENVDAAAN